MNIEVIQTDALDELNDMMAFWYLPDEKIISDDGWTYHEVYEETTQTEELAIRCCERFFCEFYQAEKEFIYRLKDNEDKETGITRLIQAITMFNTLYFKWEEETQ